MKARSSPRLPLWAWRTAFFGCMLAVMGLSLSPLDAPLPTTGWDKSNHLLGFSVMAVLGCLAYPGRWWVVLGGLLLYGGLIEGLQSLTPHRSAEWGDWLADGIGLLLGGALVRWWPGVWQRKAADAGARGG